MGLAEGKTEGAEGEGGGLRRQRRRLLSLVCDYTPGKLDNCLVADCEYGIYLAMAVLLLVLLVLVLVLLVLVLAMVLSPCGRWFLWNEIEIDSHAIHILCVPSSLPRSLSLQTS
jgi:hypothetical protein